MVCLTANCVGLTELLGFHKGVKAVSLVNVEYVPLDQVARELSLSGRQVRNLCNEFDWFGGRMGKICVITREEVEKMKVTSRRGPGRPRKSV